MTWIETVPYEAATGRLKTLYDRVKGPDDNVDNIMLAHSLRPHSMEGHMALYKSVLHHSANKVPKWFLEEKTFAEAQSAQIAELKKENDLLRKNLSSALSGEVDPVSSNNSDGASKRNGMSSRIKFADEK